MHAVRALIFAAGLGERMRPLTDATPKPLLKVAGKPLIVHHLEKLATLGVHYVVINTSHLAEQFPEALGDGSRWGLRIRYAYEGPTALETGGGMCNALPLLGDQPFMAINGDIYTDFDFAALPTEPQGLAHLLLVDNPPQHPQGDFVLDAAGQVHVHEPDRATKRSTLTFAGVGVYRPALLHDWQRAFTTVEIEHQRQPPRFGLAPLLRHAMAAHAVSGQHHQGLWTDVGTLERLAALEASVANH